MFIISYESYIKHEGALIEKLRQGTLAREQSLWHCAQPHVKDLKIWLRRRRSSGVERAIGNGEADSSILSGGTIGLQILTTPSLALAE